jgi:cytochrome c
VRLCARCHAVAVSGASPDARAPAFRDLTGQFTSLTLQRRLTEIAETGHYDMPPVSAHADEVADLVAYINGFGDAWRRDDRRDLPR